MILPKKIKIGGHTLDVKLVEKTSTNNNAGEYDAFKNLIEINNVQPVSQQQATLLHEILHAVNICMEEKDVEFLAQALYQVLVDNKLTFDGK